VSLDLESRLRVFLASAPQNVHPIMTLEISHSAMSRSYYVWREPYAGTVYADGAALEMQVANVEIQLAGSEGHLDQVFAIRISTVDDADTLRNELDRIPVTTPEKIRIVYREYLSDQLDDPQATAILQAESISYSIGAANISAVSPRLNINRCGEIYNLRDLPTLRGFL
jgi:hypothetical protein